MGLVIPVAVPHRIVPSETGSGSYENLQQEYSSEVKSNEKYKSKLQRPK